MPNRSAPLFPHRVWIWPAGDNAGFSTRTTRAVEVTTRRTQPELRVSFEVGDGTPCNDEEDEEMQELLSDLNGEKEDYNEACLARESIRPCPMLQQGQKFTGFQRMHKGSDRCPSADWKVDVLIHTLDMEKGSCMGVMTAHIPHSSTPIHTQFAGEIIDDINNSFVTCKWGASYKTDIDHWKQFIGFHSIQKRVIKSHGRCLGLSQHPYIFMRWKEMFFMNADEESGLTIAGFYYICFCRSTGKVSGYYYDQVSMPFQKLELDAVHSFPVYRAFKFCSGKD